MTWIKHVLVLHTLGLNGLDKHILHMDWIIHILVLHMLGLNRHILHLEHRQARPPHRYMADHLALGMGWVNDKIKTADQEHESPTQAAEIDNPRPLTLRLTIQDR